MRLANTIIPIAVALCLATPLGAQTRAAAAATMGPVSRPVGPVPHAWRCDACDPSRGVASRAPSPAPLSADGAHRSRARGARIGFFVGAVVGGLAGLAITDDFYNGPAVNIAVGAAGFGLLGALIGAAVGAPASGS